MWSQKCVYGPSRHDFSLKQSAPPILAAALPKNIGRQIYWLCGSLTASPSAYVVVVRGRGAPAWRIDRSAPGTQFSGKTMVLIIIIIVLRIVSDMLDD